MKVAFRVNVDSDTGYGHIFRCLNIAEGLKAFGCDSVFIGNSTPLTDDYEHHIVNADMGSAADVLETSKILGQINPSALVIDIFPEEKRAPASYPSDLGFDGNIVSFVDSDDDFVPQNTFTINANPGYRGSTQQGKCFKGPDYFILNPEFKNLDLDKNGVFISLGSVDENDDLPWILQELSDRGEKRVDILASPYASYAEKREELFAGFNNIEIHWHEKISSKELCRLLNKAELSVTNGGNVMFEMMFFATPILVVPSNQRLQKLADWFAQRKGILLCSSKNEFSINLPSARSFRPEILIDGRGVNRVIEILFPELRMAD